MKLNALSWKAWLLWAVATLGLGAGRSGLPLWWLWLTIGVVAFAALVALALLAEATKR